MACLCEGKRERKEKPVRSFTLRETEENNRSRVPRVNERYFVDTVSS